VGRGSSLPAFAVMPHRAHSSATGCADISFITIKEYGQNVPIKAMIEFFIV
jgi:peptidase E